MYDTQYVWWSLNMITIMCNIQYVWNQYMCMKTNICVWKPIHVITTMPPGRATHRRLRDLVRMGSGSSWPGTTQVIVMIRIKIVEILLAFAWVLCVNIELMWMNTITIFMSQEWACAKKRRARTTKRSLWRGADARTDSQHIIFSQNFSHDTDIRSSRNSNHRRFDHITSVGASTTPANALGELVPGKIHTKKGLDFKNWDQLIRAWV